MPNVGLPELIVIMLILALVFGGSRLPKIGENLGRSFGKLKRGVGSGPNADDADDAEDAGEAGGDTADDAEIVDLERR